MTEFKFMVAGQDRTGDFQSACASRHQQIVSDARLKSRPGSVDVGLLQDAPNPESLDRMFMELLRHRSQIDTLPFDFPRKPGLTGSIMFKIRAALWKLLRYQHDRMASRQNRVNAWMISSLEVQVCSLNEKLDELRKQIDRASNSTGKEQ